MFALKTQGLHYIFPEILRVMQFERPPPPCIIGSTVTGRITTGRITTGRITTVRITTVRVRTLAIYFTKQQLFEIKARTLQNRLLFFVSQIFSGRDRLFRHRRIDRNDFDKERTRPGIGGSTRFPSSRSRLVRIPAPDRNRDRHGSSHRLQRQPTDFRNLRIQ